MAMPPPLSDDYDYDFADVDALAFVQDFAQDSFLGSEEERTPVSFSEPTMTWRGIPSSSALPSASSSAYPGGWSQEEVEDLPAGSGGRRSNFGFPLALSVLGVWLSLALKPPKSSQTSKAQSKPDASKQASTSTHTPPHVQALRHGQAFSAALWHKCMEVVGRLPPPLRNISASGRRRAKLEQIRKWLDEDSEDEEEPEIPPIPDERTSTVASANKAKTTTPTQSSRANNDAEAEEGKLEQPSDFDELLFIAEEAERRRQLANQREEMKGSDDEKTSTEDKEEEDNLLADILVEEEVSEEDLDVDNAPTCLRRVEGVLRHRTMRLACLIECIFQAKNADHILRTCDGLGVQRVFVVVTDPSKRRQHVALQPDEKPDDRTKAQKKRKQPKYDSAQRPTFLDPETPDGFEHAERLREKLQKRYEKQGPRGLIRKRIAYSKEHGLAKPAGDSKFAKASAAGVDGSWLSRWLTVTEHASADDALAVAREEGFQTFLLDVRPQAVPLMPVGRDPPGSVLHQRLRDSASRVCLAFGSEAMGPSDELLRGCDGLVSLPMHGFADSYNVSVAAAMAIYRCRQIQNEGDCAEDAVPGGDLDESETKGLRRVMYNHMARGDAVKAAKYARWAELETPPAPINDARQVLWEKPRYNVPKPFKADEKVRLGKTAAAVDRHGSADGDGNGASSPLLTPPRTITSAMDEKVRVEKTAAAVDRHGSADGDGNGASSPLLTPPRTITSAMDEKVRVEKTAAAVDRHGSADGDGNGASSPLLTPPRTITSIISSDNSPPFSHSSMSSEPIGRVLLEKSTPRSRGRMRAARFQSHGAPPLSRRFLDIPEFEESRFRNGD